MPFRMPIFGRSPLSWASAAMTPNAMVTAAVQIVFKPASDDRCINQALREMFPVLIERQLGNFVKPLAQGRQGTQEAPPVFVTL